MQKTILNIFLVSDKFISKMDNFVTVSQHKDLIMIKTKAYLKKHKILKTENKKRQLKKHNTSVMYPK